MPPRIRQPSFQPQPLQTVLTSGSQPRCPLHAFNSHRYASMGHQPHRQTRLRRRMWNWLNGPGAVFRRPLEGSTNYLSAYDANGNLVRTARRRRAARDLESKDKNGAAESSADSEEDALSEIEAEERVAPGEERLPPETADDLRPFPLNRQFRSQPVLSEELREAIWRDVVERKLPLTVVSAAYGVSNERVGAVVRLKSLEKQWIKEGKPLARPYSRAVLSMLPQTPYVPLEGAPRSPNDSSPPAIRPVHESINDLPVHPATRPQIFYPAPESRHFTRSEAARVFDPFLPLMPADRRIPHPELVEVERDRLQGLPREEMEARHLARMQEGEDKKEREKARKQKEEEKTKVVLGRRWDFKFQEINVESVGKDGRGRSGVGWRYGAPHQDRKRGQVKIPTRVDA